MAKIYIDYEDTRVNSNLKEAINYLGNANNIRLDVPTGFSRSSDIRQIDNSVGSVYTDLNAFGFNLPYKINDHIAIYGTYTYVVKSMYSNSSKSESSGAEVSAKVTVATKDISIVLNGSDPMELSVGDTYNDPGIIVMCDGEDVTSDASIDISEDVDTTRPGTYTVTYSVTYNGVSKQAKRQVSVTDDSPDTSE